MQPREGGCFELLSEVPDVGDKAKQLLFPVLLSLVALAVMCELPTAFVVLILVFLINVLTLWLLNHVGLGALPKEVISGLLFVCCYGVSGLPCCVQRVMVVPSLSPAVRDAGCATAALPRAKYICWQRAWRAALLITSWCPSNQQELEGSFCKILSMLFGRVAG